MATKIICGSCGAEFDDSLAKCPYCDSTNIKGAEAAYMEQLEDVREELDSLTEVPIKETKTAAKKQLKFVGIVLGVLLVLVLVPNGLAYWSEHQYDRDNKADFLWKEANFPVMQEMYDQGKYDELLVFIEQASGEDKPVWEWEHWQFMDIYSEAKWLLDMYECEDFRDKYQKDYYGTILYSAFKVEGMDFLEKLTEEEKAILKPYTDQLHGEFQTRWEMSDEDYNSYYEELKNNQGYIPLYECEEYVEKWHQGK